MVDHPKAPSSLGKTGRIFWRRVHATWGDFDARHLELLRMACEALDRAEQAREAIRRDGITVPTADGTSIKSHPALGVERDCRIGFARLMRELGLPETENLDPRIPRKERR